MKKMFRTIALIAAAAISAFGCQKFTDELEATKSVEFIAEEVQTRTVFDTPEGTTYPVLWTAQDTEIQVSLNLTTPVKAAVTPSADGKKAAFTASFPQTSGSCMFLAISPAKALAGMDPANFIVKYNIPATQTPEAHSADQAAQVLYGMSDTTNGIPEKVSLKFSHLNSYMKFAFTDLKLDGASVQGASITCDDVDLAGVVAFNPLTSTGAVENGSKTVSVTTTSADEVWFGLAPVDLSGKTLKVAVKTSKGTLAKTITLPSSAKLVPGKIATLTVGMADAIATEPDRSSIKILAVGNSFSVDAMQYLYPILKQVGYKEIILGDLYIGGCSLQTHAGNVESNATAYTYYYNDSDSWKTTSGATVMDKVKSQDWDYISFQQASPNSGQAATYDPYLGSLISTIKAACPSAKIMWHMTWAYQTNANYSAFANYDYDQAKMYAAIVNAVKEKVLTRSDIDLVIPAGTAIANVRSSFIGDNTSRDGYHLNYGVGRLAAAYMWAKSIAGDISAATYVPSSYTVSDRELAAIKEAVNAAYAKPFEVTPATDADPAKGYTPNTALQAVVTAAGYNLANYEELPYGVIERGYYNSGSTAILQHQNNGVSATNFEQFAAVSYFFTKKDLPNGTLLVVDKDYMYRPEGWTEFRNKTSSRPANVTGTTSPVTKIDSGWWGDFKYRSFNIAKIGNPNLSAAEMSAIKSKFAIFVPKEGAVITDPTCDEIVELSGKSVSDYVKMPLGIVHNAYFYSADASVSKLLKLSDGYSTGKYFSATKIFAKSLLPNGTLIVNRNGYMYRPEAWTALDVKTPSSERPDETAANLVEVNDTWWGKWNYRAFNLRNSAKTELTSADYAGIEAAFCIYVPKSAMTSLTNPDEILAAYGYDINAYTKLDLGITKNAYYNSSNKSAPGPDGLWTSASNSNQFAATKVFQKADIPVGTIIVQVSGYMYRPEGWTAMKTVNASSARPANVTAMLTVVDSAWWGSWNYRAFNIAKIGNPALSATEQEFLTKEFAVYIPKK